LELLEYTRTANDNSLNFYFNVFSNGNEYSIKIETNEHKLLEWSCSCIFGVSYRFSQKNIEKDIRCKHFWYCWSLLVHLGYVY